MTRLQQIGLSVGVLCILGALGVGIYARSHRAAEPTAASAYTPPADVGSRATIVVQVSGAVARPDLYTLPASARVEQAIAAAGGLLTSADPSQVNRAAHLQDGQKIDIPFVAPAPPPAPTSAPPAARAAPSAAPPGGSGVVVNLNTATAQELEQLPGIGPALAARIVEHRQQSGPFQSVEDVAAVAGIGPGRLDAIRAHATVR